MIPTVRVSLSSNGRADQFAQDIVNSDGIMSAINFKIDVKKDHQNGEDRVLINLNGYVSTSDCLEHTEMAIAENGCRTPSSENPL